ncbi:MAG: sigma-70 family RNA polymerase sigma factor [Blastochloris sp.]|nr:sigma-70 family RNA polymerase sigma factor [Blastochloris sp.]
MQESVTELVVASQHGDLEAFGRLVVRFQRLACAVAYAVVGDVHLAEDAAQDACIEAYQNLGRLREPAAFATWFRAIVHKRADRLVRGKRPPLLPLDAAAHLQARHAEPAHLTEVRALRTAVHAAVASLPEPDRLLVSLFHLGGYSQREVAAVVDLPEQVVKKRLFRARQTLRRLLEEDMAEDFARQLSAPASFARVVQFFIAIRAGDGPAVQRMLDAAPQLVHERERWDEELSRQSRMPVVGSFTALHRAAYRGDVTLGDLLLARGADPNAATPIGQTPLHVAVLVDQPALVDRLLAAGANPHLTTDRGHTPLHWAVIRARAWHVQRLLASGADPNVADAEGRSPRDWAQLRGGEAIVHLMEGNHD